MYYLVDFAFENISNKAIERIRERANYPDKGKYKKSLNFQTKWSKGKLAKGNLALTEPEPLQLRAKLESLYQNPNSPISNQVVPTRVIGTKANPLKGNLFPNTKKVVKKTTAKTVANVAKKSNIFGSKLFPYVAAPTAIIGGLIGVNKLRGKTWNGKDK